MILCGSKSNDGWFQHCYSQKAGKDSFDGASFIVDFFKSSTVVINILSDCRRKSKKIIAAFLRKVFGMRGGTHKESAFIFFSIVERAAVLEINSSSGVHFPLPVHFKVGGTDDCILFD